MNTPVVVPAFVEIVFRITGLPSNTSRPALAASVRAAVSVFVSTNLGASVDLEGVLVVNQLSEVVASSAGPTPPSSASPTPSSSLVPSSNTTGVRRLSLRTVAMGRALATSNADFTYTVRVIVPPSVDNATLAAGLRTQQGNMETAVAGTIAFVFGVPVSVTVTRPASAVRPLAPVLDAQARTPGGGGAGAAAAPADASGAIAAVIIVVAIIGVALSFVIFRARSGIACLGMECLALATCCGRWPMPDDGDEDEGGKKSFNPMDMCCKKKNPLSSSTKRRSKARDMGEDEEEEGVGVGMAKEGAVVVNPVAAAKAKKAKSKAEKGDNDDDGFASDDDEDEDEGAAEASSASAVAISIEVPALLVGGRKGPLTSEPGGKEEDAEARADFAPKTAANPMRTALPPTVVPGPAAPLMAPPAAMAPPAPPVPMAPAPPTTAVGTAETLHNLATEAAKLSLRRDETLDVRMASAQLSRAASSAERTEKAAALSATTRLLFGGKKPMTDLDAALFVQRMWKGYKVRQALAGWKKVIDDDGDVFFQHAESGALEWVLPTIPFHVPRDENGDSGEADEDGKVTGPDGRKYYTDGPGGPRLAWGWRRCEDETDVWYENDETGGNSWVPVLAEGESAAAAEEEEANVEYDADGTKWYLDGPGGGRLALHWKRCEDETDVWYENSETGENSWEPIYAD